MIEKLMLIPNLTGLIFIMAGLVTLIFPPKKINSLYGYRTPLSMKNIDNWHFAQRLSAQLLIIGGLVLLLTGIIGLLLNLDEAHINMIGFVMMIIIVIVLFVKTESAIKKFEQS